MKVHNKTNIIPVGLASVTVLTGAFLLANKTHAEDVVDEVNITVPVSCSMSGIDMDSHTAEIANGTSNSAIGETTINALCNDANGFAIYTIGFTDDTEGKNVLSNATLGATYDIATGTATSGTSQWAMKVTTPTSPEPAYPVSIENDFDEFHTVPDDYTMVAKRESATDIGASATGSTIKTTYQAYIDSNQPAGTYTGQVKYVLVHPADATPPAPIITSCTTPVPNLTYMQDLNSTNKASILAGMTEDAQYFLKDKRDEKSYCVAKLKDGNIWMTQNLDHDIVTTPNYYTNENTDIGWNSNTSSYDTASWTPDKATYATDTTWTSGYTIQASYDPGDLYVGTDAINGWKYYWSCNAGSCDATIYPELNSEWKAFFDSCDTGTVKNCDWSLQPTNNTSSEGIDQYHLGNYYNWTAAIAMNDSSSYTVQYTDVDRSICPANWTLAKGGNNTSNGSFYYLINQYGTWNSGTSHMDNGYNLTESPIYISPSGYWYGSLESVGTSGFFWSSVVSNSYNAYHYNANVNGYVHPGFNVYSRSDGFPVRCLAR